MSSILNITLTDELHAFVCRNCGEGTPHASPSAFVIDLLEQKKLQQEATEVREGILAGYQHAIHDRTHVFEGDLRGLLKNSQRSR